MTTSHPVIVYDVELARPERTANTPPYFKDSPLQVLRYDLGLILRHAAEIPFIFVPLPRNGTNQKDVTFMGLLVQVGFVIISFAVTGVICSGFTVGFPTPVLAILILVFTVMGISKAQGAVRVEPDEKYNDEAWLL